MPKFFNPPKAAKLSKAFSPRYTLSRIIAARRSSSLSCGSRKRAGKPSNLFNLWILIVSQDPSWLNGLVIKLQLVDRPIEHLFGA